MSAPEPEAYEVEIRLADGWTCNGLAATQAQLQDESYLVGALLQDLSGCLYDQPDELEVRVGGGPWRRLGDEPSTPAPSGGGAST